MLQEGFPEELEELIEYHNKVTRYYNEIDAGLVGYEDNPYNIFWTSRSDPYLGGFVKKCDKENSKLSRFFSKIFKRIEEYDKENGTRAAVPTYVVETLCEYSSVDLTKNPLDKKSSEEHIAQQEDEYKSFFDPSISIHEDISRNPDYKGSVNRIFFLKLDDILFLKPDYFIRNRKKLHIWIQRCAEVIYDYITDTKGFPRSRYIRRDWPFRSIDNALLNTFVHYQFGHYCMRHIACWNYNYCMKILLKNINDIAEKDGTNIRLNKDILKKIIDYFLIMLVNHGPRKRVHFGLFDDDREFASIDVHMRARMDLQQLIAREVIGGERRDLQQLIAREVIGGERRDLQQLIAREIRGGEISWPSEQIDQKHPKNK
jgi:hypothetical protein